MKASRFKWLCIHLSMFFCLSIIIFIGVQIQKADAKQVIDNELVKLIKQKEQGVQRGDIHLFLKGIDPKSLSYWNEQKRWFQDAINYVDKSSFHLDLLREETWNNRTIAVIKQRYLKKGKLQESLYKVEVKKVAGHWLEVDFPFYEVPVSWGKIKVETKDLLSKATMTEKAIDNAISYFKNKYNWSPDHLEIKLFRNPEPFLQSVKLSLPNWVGGWNESGQAIKLLTEPKFQAEVDQMGLAHELTHQMISDLSNDNAAYWLQEGAAMYYERQIVSGVDQLKMESSYLWGLEELEQKKLEQMNGKDVLRYYLSCQEVFRQLKSELGEDGIRTVFDQLREMPMIDKDSNLKIEVCNDRTKKAIQIVREKLKKVIDQA